MMPSFVSMISLMVAVMVAGKSIKEPSGTFKLILLAALLQTAVTFFDLYTMEIPTP